MTLEHLPDLEDGRWDWSWYENVPRRLLTDAVANEIAAPEIARRNDYDNVHESNLPFLAYELNALAFDLGGTEASKRRALNLAHDLNRLIGTEEAFYTLMEVNRCAGFHRYTPGGKPKTAVELSITPPVDRLADADFITYITDRAKRCWPYTLAVTAVHILSVSSTTLTVYGATVTTDLSGDYPWGA